MACVIQSFFNSYCICLVCNNKFVFRIDAVDSFLLFK